MLDCASVHECPPKGAVHPKPSDYAAIVLERRNLALLAALVVLVALSVGCDSIDPTEQAFAITFRDDIGRDVHLKLCSDSQCHHFDYSDELKVRGSVEENVSDRSLMTRWLVEDDETGKNLGCLPLKFDQKYDHVVVVVSQKVSCPGTEALKVQKGRGRGRS
jgi:hypothetical protein